MGRRYKIRVGRTATASAPLTGVYATGSAGAATGAAAATLADIQLPLLEWDATYSPPTPKVYVSSTGFRNDGTTPADYTTFAAAYNAVSRDTTIKIRNGDVQGIGDVTLGAKAGSGWIYIEAEDMSAVPAAGVRAVAGRYGETPNIGTLPIIQHNKIGVASYGALTLSSTNYVYFAGIWFRNDPAETYYAHVNMVTIAETCDHIVFDRCVAGNEGRAQSVRPIYTNAAYSVIKNCELETRTLAGYSDGQCILSIGPSTPTLVQNNTLRGASECIMTGGGDVADDTKIPRDWTIRGNYFHWPTDMFVAQSDSGGYTLKNHLEIKLGERFLIENNVFENHWDAYQSQYHAIVLKGTNQDGTTAYSPVCKHVTFRYNRLHNLSTGGVTFSDGDNISGGTAASTTHCAVYYNLFTKVHTLVDSVTAHTNSAAMRGITFSEKTGFTPSNRYFLHNTVESAGSAVFHGNGTVGMSCTILNNLTAAIDNPYGSVRYNDGVDVWTTATLRQNAIAPATNNATWVSGNSGFTARTNSMASVFLNQPAGDLRPATDLAGLADQVVAPLGYSEIGCNLQAVAAAVAGARPLGDLPPGY